MGGFGQPAATISLVFVTVLSAGCGFVPSSHRVDLYRTSWRVAEVGGVPLRVPLQLDFNPGGQDGTVVLETPCGANSMNVNVDSDGDQIAFYGSSPSPTECSTEARSVSDAVLTALQNTEQWSVENDTKVILQGDARIVLER